MWGGRRERCREDGNSAAAKMIETVQLREENEERVLSVGGR